VHVPLVCMHVHVSACACIYVCIWFLVFG